MASPKLTSSKSLSAVLLFLLVIGVYWPTFQAGFIWDDDSMLNQFVKASNGLRYIWFSTELPDYFPLTSTTLWLEHKLWGERAAGYHIINVFLHALGSVLLWRVFARLRLPGAWFAAALFAVHPLTVDSVAWIAERKNTLSFVFFVFSVLFYLQWDEGKRTGEIGRPNRRWYLLSFTSFLLALLSKTAVVGLPFVLLLCTAWRDRSDSGVNVGSQATWAMRVRPLIPFFALALVMGLVTVWFQYNRAIGDDFIHDKPLLLRAATAGWAAWFYFWKAIWPVNLVFVYPDWNPDLRSIGAWLPSIAIMVTFVLLAWRVRTSFIARAVFFALIYFVLMLLPVLGFLKIYFHRYSPVADHWQYFSLPGLTALVAAAVFYTRKDKAGRHDGLRRGAAASLLVVCCVLTWKHSRTYRDAETLWLDTLAKNPGAWLAHNNLGLLLDTQGRREEAFAHYSKSLAINPKQIEAHNNLGSALLAQGKLDAAMAEFKTAETINPRSAVTHYNIGNVLDQQGKRVEAIASYRKALELNPNYVDAYNNLGCVMALAGEIDAAIFHFREALRLDPDDVNALNNLGSTLIEQGRPNEAIPLLTKATELSPGYADAYFNLGNGLSAIGDLDNAIERYSAALRLNSRMPAARYRLGNALLQTGKSEEALTQFEAALELQPNLPEAHYQAGMIYAEKKQIDKAIEHLKEAVRLKPDWVEALNNLAWKLATQPRSEMRDGGESLKLARRAVELTGGDHPGTLDTLAAAYAETGDFKNAILVLEKALAAERLSPEAAAEMRLRLDGYRAGRPFRE